MSMTMVDVRLLRGQLEEYTHLAKLLQTGRSWQTDAMERKLTRLSEELAAQLWEISKFIEEISDPELRLIFTLRYFRGYTWPQVAAHLPTDLSGDGARMKHDRYIKKLGSKGFPFSQSSK